MLDFIIVIGSIIDIILEYQLVRALCINLFFVELYQRYADYNITFKIVYGSMDVCLNQFQSYKASSAIWHHTICHPTPVNVLSGRLYYCLTPDV